MKVIITIPAYNEEASLREVISNIKNVMDKTNYDYIIQVLDDGSKDRTVEIAKEVGAKIYSNRRNLGLAKTFQEELRYAIENKADIIVHTDADGQYDPSHIPELIKKIEEGYDLVLGSRFGKKIKHMPFMKRIGNKAFSKVISSLTGIDITDSTTGYRAFTKEVAEEIEFINTFTYTQEQIIKAAKEKFRITEIFVRTRKTRESRLFKNPFEYVLKAWINILRIYRDYDPLKFFGITGGILSSLGLIIGLWFVYLHFTTGITGHLGLLILMILLLLTGIQIILFGFLADMRK